MQKNFLVNNIINPIIIGIILVSLGYQMYSFWSFKNQGKRFTLNNGQELCIRIRELEIKTGIEPKLCDY
jgi:hypothetical protein